MRTYKLQKPSEVKCIMMLHVTEISEYFVGERKLVLKHIIHIKDNVDVRQCSKWSTNILLEQTTSIFRAEHCLFYPEDGGNRFTKLLIPIYQNTQHHISEDNVLDAHQHENL